MKTAAISVVLTLLVGCTQELLKDDSPTPAPESDATSEGLGEGGSANGGDAEIDGGSETKGDGGSDAAPEVDGGVEGPPPLAGWYLTTPRCPPDILPANRGSETSPHMPAHPMTFVDVVKGADLAEATSVSARWTGARSQATPLVRACRPAFVSSPAGPPCTVDSLIEFTTDNGAKIEILIGLSLTDLAPFADGRKVSLQLGPVIDDADGSPSRSVEIREEPSGILLVAVYAIKTTPSLEGFRWDDLQLAFDAPQCATERDACLRVFVSRRLAVTSASSTHELDPGQSVEVRSKERNYRITHRRAVERAYGVFEYECADLSFVTAGVELVQLP